MIITVYGYPIAAIRIMSTRRHLIAVLPASKIYQYLVSKCFTTHLSDMLFGTPLLYEPHCYLVCSVSIKSVLTFTDASEEDLGLYMVEKSDEPMLSSSYDLTAEGNPDCEEWKHLNVTACCESCKKKEWNCRKGQLDRFFFILRDFPSSSNQGLCPKVFCVTTSFHTFFRN